MTCEFGVVCTNVCVQISVQTILIHYFLNCYIILVLLVYYCRSASNLVCFQFIFVYKNQWMALVHISHMKHESVFTVPNTNQFKFDLTFKGT